jgi:hypothetical protein
MPVFIPCAPAGLWMWAASPARKTLPRRNRWASRLLMLNSVSQTGWCNTSRSRVYRETVDCSSSRVTGRFGVRGGNITISRQLAGVPSGKSSSGPASER